ncbi:hypothetical protein [Ruminococcus bromii]
MCIQICTQCAQLCTLHTSGCPMNTPTIFHFPFSTFNLKITLGR